MPRTGPVLGLTALLVGLLMVPATAHERHVAPPPVVAFTQWAPAACPAPSGIDPSPTRRVVVHHTHHPVAATPEQVLPALAELCRLHVARGFETVGYHYVVDPWGTVYQARGLAPDASGAAPRSQPEGAHVQGGNPGAVGIAFLGDHEAEAPTRAAVDAATHLIAWLVASTDRSAGDVVEVETTGGGTSLHAGPVAVGVVDGHGATNATLCPGRHLLALLPLIRTGADELLGGPVGTVATRDQVRASHDGVALVTSGPILAAPALQGPFGDGTVPLPAVGVLLLLLLLVRRRA